MEPVEYFDSFFLFHPPFCLFLAWRSSWLEVGITGHNFGREPSKEKRGDEILKKIFSSETTEPISTKLC
jgi:hypothetical protein